MKVFLLILTIVLLSGCASSTPSDFKIFESKKNEFIKNEESKSYILGKRQSCYVGDKIINKFSYKKHLHQEYCIGVTNKGVQSFYCKGLAPIAINLRKFTWTQNSAICFLSSFYLIFFLSI